MCSMTSCSANRVSWAHNPSPPRSDAGRSRHSRRVGVWVPLAHPPLQLGGAVSPILAASVCQRPNNTSGVAEWSFAGRVARLRHRLASATPATRRCLWLRVSVSISTARERSQIVAVEAGDLARLLRSGCHSTPNGTLSNRCIRPDTPSRRRGLTRTSGGRRSPHTDRPLGAPHSARDNGCVDLGVTGSGGPVHEPATAHPSVGT